VGGIDRGLKSKASPRQKQRTYPKKKKKKKQKPKAKAKIKAGSIYQVVEHLPSKLETLSLNPSIAKDKK
jgi:hypothetical protein